MPPGRRTLRSPVCLEHRILRAPLSHLGSFRTYRGRTIADINANPQSNFPPIRLGVLAGRRWPPQAPPGPSFSNLRN